MRFIKQDKTIDVRNIESDFKSTNTIRKHSDLLPNTVRALIVGPSNCGKTNLMMSLIESPNGLKFENVYIFSKSLYQPKYKFLESVLSEIKGMGFYTFSSNDDILPPDQAKPNSVMIFDDVACEKQDNIRMYFSMGRHKNIDSFYLAQTYSKIPKQLIRDNANFLVIFKQDEMNIKHIYRDHVNPDMAFNTFLDICSKCWEDRYGFLVISKDDPLDVSRYRKGFDTFIEL